MYTLNRRLGGQHSRLGRFRAEKNLFCPFRDSNLRSVCGLLLLRLHAAGARKTCFQEFLIVGFGGSREYLVSCTGCQCSSCTGASSQCWDHRLWILVYLTSMASALSSRSACKVLAVLSLEPTLRPKQVSITALSRSLVAGILYRPYHKRMSASVCVHNTKFQCIVQPEVSP